MTAEPQAAGRRLFDRHSPGARLGQPHRRGRAAGCAACFRPTISRARSRRRSGRTNCGKEP